MDLTTSDYHNYRYYSDKIYLVSAGKSSEEVLFKVHIGSKDVSMFKFY